jgi:RND family efflux transporter MFP subunit
MSSDQTESPVQSSGRKGSPARVIALVGAAALAAVIFARVQHHHALATEVRERGEAVPVVQVMTVTDSAPDTPQRLPGQTAPWHVATLYGRVNGFITQWSADIGDVVHRGQTLATIDTPELDAELHAAKARLDAARAQADLARTTDDRWRTSPPGAVADQERDAKHAERAAAEAAVRLEVAHVNQFDVLTGFKHVIAPFDGRVSERSIDIGTLVSAGGNSTPLYRIVQDAPLRVYVSVPQSIITDLSHGDGTAEIFVPGRTEALIGKVARSSAALDSQTRSLRVEVDLPNSDHAVLPGSYVDVALHLGRRGVVSIPAQTLRMTAQGAEVLRVDGDGHLQVVPVTIARDNGKWVEIQAAVTRGDRLVENPSDAFKDGQTVRVASSASQGHP